MYRSLECKWQIGFLNEAFFYAEQFISRSGASLNIKYTTQTQQLVCIWPTKIIAFEQKVWLLNVFCFFLVLAFICTG